MPRQVVSTSGNSGIREVSNQGQSCDWVCVVKFNMDVVLNFRGRHPILMDSIFVFRHQTVPIIKGILIEITFS